MAAASTFTVLNDLDFYEVLGDTRGVSIVFFTKAGCSSCRAWAQLLQQLQQVQPDIHVFSVDAQESAALASEYEIFHLPALFVFVDGNYQAPLQCEARLPVLQRALTDLLALPAVEAP
jgi:thioredoxin 1